MSRTERGPLAPAQQSSPVGIRNALLFVVMLVTFVTESEMTKYVESTLDYRQPYTILYIAHSSMTIVLPLHLFYLRFTTSTPVSSYVRGLVIAVRRHLAPASDDSRVEVAGSDKHPKLPVRQFIFAVLWCTIGITAPALLWFAALPLSSVADVTAIWNSNAFWAYIFTVKFQRLNWEPRKIGAVLVAVLGVLVVVYGSGGRPSSSREEAKAPFIGNVLTLVASLCYALYQVLYDMYAVPSSENMHGSNTEANWQRVSVTSFDDYSDDGLDDIPQDGSVVYPPPFGLYANLITSGIGLATLLLFWIPIPLLDILGIEAFHWPTDFKVYLGLAGIAISALAFLASFMVMIGAWGAIVTAVGSLLTIVLVILTDILFKNGLETLSVWDIAGSAMIVCAFTVLSYESLRQRL